MPAPIPADEQQRLAELHAYKILDTLPEEAYDDVTFLASAICGSPIALISLVDQDRQWFKSSVGLDSTETPRDVAFCAHTILDPTSLLVVPDATKDPRFSNNPLVTSAPGIRFYAGAPLVAPSGRALGALCVIDRKPRELSPQQAKALKALARQVIAQLELRRTVAQLESSIDDLRGYEALLEKYQRSLEASYATVAEESITDSLTNLKNRRAFEVQLESEYLRAERFGSELALAILDLDQFKIFNDMFGHPAGDDVLRTVARLLEAGARTTDFVARFGGEEFVVLFPNTSVDAAHVIAERLRKSLDAHQWEHRRVTVSIGVAGSPTALTGPQDLVALADRALYRAKQQGRNRVVAAADAGDRTSRPSPVPLAPPVDHDPLDTEATPAETAPLAPEVGIRFVVNDTASQRREVTYPIERDEAEV